jgi:hypothetical protein
MSGLIQGSSNIIVKNCRCVVVHIYHLGTQEAKARELQVPGQPELHSKTLSQEISQAQWLILVGRMGNKMNE